MTLARTLAATVASLAACGHAAAPAPAAKPAPPQIVAPMPTPEPEPEPDDADDAPEPMGVGAGAAAAMPAPPPPPPRPAYPRRTFDPAATYAVAIDGYPTVGKPTALVTLVRNYEYACPYCERSRATMTELKAKYGDDLRIVYRPYIVHPTAASASALAACAAHHQGKFVEMDELLWTKGYAARAFDKSRGGPTPGGSGECWYTPGGCTNVVDMANQAGLEMVQFQADMAGSCVDEVARSVDELAQLGVSATPMFFINGRYLSGAQPTSTFVTLIDEELAKAKARTKKKSEKKKDYYKTWVLDVGETQAPLTPPRTPPVPPQTPTPPTP